MIRRLMVDSGAFSVWNKGAVISLEEYAEFCVKNPDASYYVNLDVIPGKPREKKGLTPLAREEAARGSWKNYRYLLSKGIPKSKLIPVFHQHEDPKWLVKYLEFGTPYIGISPANDMTTLEKIFWMAALKKYLFDGAGRPVCKTHGFAVTSYKLMQYWEWHSVDSKSWKDCAAWGGIYLPKFGNGQKWDCGQPPLQVQASPVLLHKARPDENIQSLLRRKAIASRLLEWLDYCDVKLGAYVKRQETQSYKLEKDKEYWFNKKKGVVLETTEKGAITHFEVRCHVNATFMRMANKALKDTVKHIYFAGAPVPEYYNLEPKLGRRLLTYHDIGKGKEDKGARRCFLSHLKLLNGE